MKIKNLKLTVFAIHHPYRAPNERYRWMQFYPHLKQRCNIQYLYLLNEKDDKILFYSNNYLLKIFILIKTFIKRTLQVLFLKKTDAIIIYRELHWLHFPLWIKILKLKSRKIIYDFDDAVFLKTPNTFINILKQPSLKTKSFIKNTNITITGNAYLQQFALQYNHHSIIIPTVVDTDYFTPILHLRFKENKIIIGWMGSHSTIQHLLNITDVLQQIKNKYPYVEFKIVGKKTYIPELNIFAEDWDMHTEVQILNTFDIGIMPLPNDEWSKGKCGLKMLTYMSCQVPCVASNVGVNTEIVQKTQGGFLANNYEEWINSLSLLIENKTLRTQMGEKGREGVIKYYSVSAYKQKFIDTIISLEELL